MLVIKFCLINIFRSSFFLSAPSPEPFNEDPFDPAAKAYDEDQFATIPEFSAVPPERNDANLLRSRLPGKLGEYPGAHQIFVEVLNYLQTTFFGATPKRVPVILSEEHIFRNSNGTLEMDNDNQEAYSTTRAMQIVKGLGRLLQYLVCGDEVEDLKHCSTNLKNLVEQMSADTVAKRILFSEVLKHAWVTEALADQGESIHYLLVSKS